MPKALTVQSDGQTETDRQTSRQTGGSGGRVSELRVVMVASLLSVVTGAFSLSLHHISTSSEYSDH